MHTTRSLECLVASTIALALIGCAGYAGSLPVDGGVGWTRCGAGPDSVAVQYLGVEGFLIQWRGRGLLTAPMFSNPRALTVALWRIGANPRRIDRYLPPVENVEAVLVGHAHYDHLLDVPYIASRKARDARVYGSATAVNILHAALPRERLVSIRETASAHGQPGAWHRSASGAFRFMAIESEHAPNIDGYTLYTGHIDSPLERLPDTARGWKAGTTYAYLIDLLGADGSVAFRIHFQDAAATPPAGFIPQLDSQDRAPVDLAITCVPGTENVTGYPERAIEHLRPRHVLLGHWENLFAEPASGGPALRVVATADVPGFIERLEAALPPESSWTLPRPGACFHYGLASGYGADHDDSTALNDGSGAMD